MTASVSVEVSPGELIDKITILEIKLERIEDEDKLKNVKLEWQTLTRARDEAIEATPELEKLTKLTGALKESNERLVEIDEISPQLLVEVLRQGEVPLFEAMYAKLTGLRPKLVSRIVYEPGGEALAVACKAVGIDKPNFASLFMLTRKAHAKDKVISPRELTPVLEFFDNIKLESATVLLERWRRDPDYLDSIRALESPEGKDDKN